MTLVLLIALLVLAGFAAMIWWERTHPSPLPYSQRFMLDFPRPFIGRDRVVLALSPQPGERILELGPGTGHYSLAVAKRLSPGGSLELLDIEQRYLDETLRRGAGRGIENVTATCGDAASLPYDDASFDAAFLVQVLGEVPDQQAAVRELARVIKPGGRLVVGENVLDPHVVSTGALRSRAGAAGFEPAGVSGSAFGYVARFSRPALAGTEPQRTSKAA